MKLSLLALAVTASCRKPIAQEQCERLLNRYVELLYTQDRQDFTHEEMARMKREARSLAAGDPYFQDCPGHVTQAALDCALRAQDPNELERCLQ